MKKLLIFILLFVSVGANASIDLQAILGKLDKSLSHKDEYEKIKTDRIDNLRSLIATTNDPEVKYETMCKLFEEYKSYRFDSASVYANRCLELAGKLKNQEYIVESQCNVAFSLVAAGIPLEANRILSSINAEGLPPRIKKNYYFTLYKLWSEEANRIQSTPLYSTFSDKSKAYLDSLCMILDKSTPDYWNFTGSKLMREHRYTEALKAFDRYSAFGTLTAHEKAMLYAEEAWAYIWMKDEDKAIECFAESAIYDNESATREITALYLLAQHIANRGESERAIRYVHLALDEINFYDANQRKVEIGGILPQIEQERYNIIRSQRNTMIVAGGLALLLFVAIFVIFLMVRKKNRLLTEAEETEKKNLAALEQVNAELTEANNIKTEYVGLSFYANAEAIAKMEKLYKGIERQLTTKQYDKIKETVNPKNLEKERANMYQAFDASFLGLFPNFIEDYNKMFTEEDRRYPEQENTLTSEMRIFALIRLGITDSERIAKFLDYSVHTVNTYKTRIKNRSIVENDQFENNIMQI